MPRDRGWLKSDALITSGVMEQCATIIEAVTHSVSLSHERFGGYVVTHRVGDETHRIEYGVHLWQARNEFKRIAASIGIQA